MAKKRRKSKPKLLPKRRKYKESTSRNFKDPKYVEWKKAVKTRDNYTCQWPGCLKRSRLQVHHIKTWAKYPHLRFTVGNGVTLCKFHHDSIKNKEEIYESFFLKLLEWQMLEKIKKYSRFRRKDD